MDPVKKSLISLHLTVMLLGGTALFSKIIPLGAIDITFGRSVFACIFLFLVAKLTGEGWRLKSNRDYAIAFGLGIIMAVHWVTYFMAMQYSSVSVGIIALFTFPVITVLLEPYFEKIKLCWQDIASAIVVLVGIVLIVPDASLDNDVTLGVIIGVFSAFLYAIRNLLHRNYFSHYSGAKAMAWQTLIVCPTLVFFISDDLPQIDMHTLWLLVALGIFFTAVPHAMVASALKHLRAKTFSLVACMQPFYAVLFAMFLINEQPNWQTIVGGLLVISAAVYETINTHRENRKDK
ncbi:MULTISPECIES: DMT family transporter [Alteromonadaceae]|uniref:DMT family transporter n=1 Tax=Brumicola blandensis TaxID=3075611 RepID=A0AAW8R4M0_9ALTE|nr:MULTISPECIES: DMT family transporter [unclassified Alteromonas]MDT0583000.1 DMT family transporter [Alteromonas sp. W409]MDT0627305.1 DMT family transporter [Alteromonas sp. W364]